MRVAFDGLADDAANNALLVEKMKQVPAAERGARYRAVIVLMRHGDAMSEEEDPSRPLSTAGREHVEAVGDRLAAIVAGLDEIRHSGKARARETAEILAARAGVAPDRVRKVAGLRPNDDVDPVAEILLGRVAGQIVEG